MASEATTIVKQETEKHISELIAERAERGWDLHLRRRQLIIKTDADTYTVPAESGHKTYTVHYGDQVEDCTCADFGVHRGEVACKHLTAVHFSTPVAGGFTPGVRCVAQDPVRRPSLGLGTTIAGTGRGTVCRTIRRT